MSGIIVGGAREGNLKNVSLEIPKGKLVVFTGLSGSGKSTLAIDVIFNECQRQYLEAIGLQGICKPKIDYIRNVSPAIAITQKEANKNPRSTVGTQTNIYTDLRMLYEKLAVRTCPQCHHAISAAECKEEVVKVDGDFEVFMYCSKCNPVECFSDVQKAILYNGFDSDEVKMAFPDIKQPKTVGGGRFEGVMTALWRRMSDKGGDAKKLNDYFDFDTCPDCRGERLGETSRNAKVNGTRLPSLSVLSLEELQVWLRELEGLLSNAERSLVESYLLDLKTKIHRLVNVGLGYLSLDRQMITLSGGELQRVKLAAALDSDLTGIIYIMDEPTIGLHPQDTIGMMQILTKLRDMGNTVIVIEHDPDVMAQADYIVDIGPGSGKHGGRVIGAGTLEEIMGQETSVTGTYLRKDKQDEWQFRAGSQDVIEVNKANLHNLKSVDVRFPVGCLVAVTGVSGSGKSTLVFDVLGAGKSARSNSFVVRGMELFDQVITIEQSAITRMKRSNVATYSEVYAEIRKIFGGLEEARANGLSARDFSFNTPGGRCENCEGLGYVTSNMLFFQDIEVTCPVCGGKQFNDEVLSIKYGGYNIKDILQMSVEEALVTFDKYPKIQRILTLLQDVGLGYLELGQSLTTLSGGEGQRLKLATELISNAGKRSLYLMDEPTTGLHPVDVEKFLVLLNRIVESGNTVIVVEHNQQVIRASDWIIDLGPAGGEQGGQVVFTGTPLELLKNGTTATAECLRKTLQ